MSFDPEKVERFSYDELGISEYVSGSNYDKLLAEYRAAMCSIERLLEARFRRVAMSASELQELVEGEMEKSRDELEP